MLGQSELAARLAQAIDDLDGHNLGGRHGLLVLRHVACDDAIEADVLPQPARQPDIAEAAGVGPSDVAKANADDVGIVGRRDVVVIREEA